MIQTQKATSTINWTGAFLVILAFCIPFAKRFAPPFIVLLGIAAIVNSIQTKRLYFSKKDIPLYLLALLFLLHIVGLSYSENTEYAWTEIGIKLSFLSFPLIALLLPAIHQDLFDRIKRAFVYGCIGYLLVSVATGVYDSFAHNDFSYLSYELLSAPYHPTYAATYQAMALFILMQFDVQGKYLFGRRVLHRIACVLIILFVSMLASKAGLLALWISLLMGGYYLYQNKQPLGKVLAITATLLLFSIATALFLPGVSTRIGNAVQDMQTENHASQNETTAPQQAHSSTSLRMVTWGASLKLLLENPAGVGTGDTTHELVKIYESKSEQHAAEKALNAHNQFLQTGAELGWPALIALCGSLLLLFALYFKNKDLLLLNFLLLCGMNFLFESFLEVQAGIVFFCFWILVFLKFRK